MMASKTSGAVIELVLSTAPTAASRLGDETLFLGYLQFLNTLVSQAPRGMRPMLENLEVLFNQLTSGWTAPLGALGRMPIAPTTRNKAAISA